VICRTENLENIYRDSLFCAAHKQNDGIIDVQRVCAGHSGRLKTKIRFPLLVIYWGFQTAKLLYFAYSRIIESRLVQLGDEFNGIGV
jgi:hypothetical protein